jgi:glycosyltransferase involved in cell wall biosynthesis
MKPVRILHVVGAMNRAGTETWLMHVLRHIDRDKFRTDFLVHTDQPAAYDEELKALGSRILRCPNLQNPLLYGRRFLEIANQFGPFDVVHSHVHHFSGYVVALARVAGIPVRISHSHNDTRAVEARINLARKAYLLGSQQLIASNCTHGLAASDTAGEALFGSRWRSDRRMRVLCCGVDLAPFLQTVDRQSVRSEFGFDDSNLVFGHVGRFDPQKNHAFLVEIAAEIVKRTPRARFLFVGDGPLRSSMEDLCQRAGIADKTVFAGSRGDVPRLMTGAMDRFLFPSLHEGLGLVLIEAQAAHLPATISDAVPHEATVIPELTTRISLTESAGSWAQCALQASEHRLSSTFAAIAGGPFNIAASVHALEKIYAS